jgi:uncharacterized LabA/DUF88 family protein
MASNIPSRKSETPTLAIVRKVLRLLRSELLKVKGTYFHMAVSKASQAGGLPSVKPKRPKITQESSISFKRLVKKCREVLATLRGPFANSRYQDGRDAVLGGLDFS